MRTWLAVGIAGWTLIAWAGRIRLLTDAEQGDLSNWARIGGSLLIGAAAATVLILAGGGQLERWILTLFAAWSVGIWLRSLVIVWMGDNRTAFKLVHTVLATGFLFLAYLALRTGWSPRSD